MPVDVESPEAVELKQRIDDQGNIVRKVKTEGGEKSDIDAAVQLLLKLKSDYKSLTGVDLAGGGSSKKGKKEKKAAAKEPQPKGDSEPKKAKAKSESEKTAQPVQVSEKLEQKSANKPAVESRDMNMTSVLTRLAQRASQTDQLVAHLKTQLNSLRQSAALSACRVEEERLRTENDTLKMQVEELKNRLVQVEVRNGVQQVSLPARTSTQTPHSQTAPVAAKIAKPTAKQPQSSSQPPKELAKEGKKQEKKVNKPKVEQKGGSGAPVDISRIAMKVGKIVDVKLHPDADSLYVETVDLGEEKARTILSGLVKHVPIEQMRDRLAIFMSNLKPAKMRGIFSEGMIMCGSTPEKVEIIVPPAGSKIGDVVYVEGYDGSPDEMLNPKKKIFEQVQPDLRINEDGVAIYKGVAWKVKGLDGLCTVPTMRGTPIK